MITSRHIGTKSISRPASRGTAMLKKRRQMTQRQALHSGKWGRADLHMHSTYSDGIGTIEQILDHVELNTDLDGSAISDHDVVEGGLRARGLWKQTHYRFDFSVGEERSASECQMRPRFI